MKPSLGPAGMIEAFGLVPHPEGGYYRETYRAADGSSTAILFLLPAGAVSRLHRIKSDELWHFHLGGPLTITEIGPSGLARETVLGADIGAGQALQHSVPGGTWFGAAPLPGTPYALVGCTVAPAFRFEDFELGERRALLKAYPGARGAILNLTTEPPSCD